MDILSNLKLKEIINKINEILDEVDKPKKIKRIKWRQVQL